MSALDTQEGGTHYKDMKIQPVEFCFHNNIPAIEASIIKYACRHRNKNGIEDLKKIIHYAELLIELEYSCEANSARCAESKRDFLYKNQDKREPEKEMNGGI